MFSDVLAVAGGNKDLSVSIDNESLIKLLIVLALGVTLGLTAYYKIID